MKPGALVVSCEHGGNQVPREYARFFRGAAARQALASHRGWDPGALAAARALARALGREIEVSALVTAEVTRLLCDLNRSEGRREAFSEFSRVIVGAEREELLARFHRPYRDELRAALRAAIAKKGRVLHLSSHSFTPKLDGVAREAEIGVLYDPRRKWEAEVAAELAAGIRAAVRARGLAWRVRRNYPYKGWTDGLTTQMRKEFAGGRYAGVEVEVRQGMEVGEVVGVVGDGIRRVFGG